MSTNLKAAEKAAITAMEKEYMMKYLVDNSSPEATEEIIKSLIIKAIYEYNKENL